MQNAPTHSPKKVRRVFFYLLLLFMVPLLLASWMAFKHASLSSHTTQHGQLLQPPLDMSQLNLQGGITSWKEHWLLFYVALNRCDKNCETALYDIRQIRTATGKDADRVQRAILTFSDTAKDAHLEQTLADEFKGTLHFTVSKAAFKQFLQQHVLEEGIYIADPLGNVMLFYPLKAEPMGIFKDLTRLLKLSHIG